jgi:hypothetical protein
MANSQKLWVVVDRTSGTIVGTTLSRDMARQLKFANDRIFGIPLTKAQLKQIATQATNR